MFSPRTLRICRSVASRVRGWTAPDVPSYRGQTRRDENPLRSSNEAARFDRIHPVLSISPAISLLTFAVSPLPSPLVLALLSFFFPVVLPFSLSRFSLSRVRPADFPDKISPCYLPCDDPLEPRGSRRLNKFFAVRIVCVCVYICVRLSRAKLERKIRGGFSISN